MITMYEMIMTNALDANACLTPRGVTGAALWRSFWTMEATDMVRGKWMRGYVC
jgi:hypothetical protein